MSKIYDFITIGAGGSGLFLNVNLPKDSSKLILEKNKILWIKVLMSGWERANLSNIDIEPMRDYFSCNTKSTIGFFKRWTNYDTINFFETNGVKTKIEDRWRVITASGHARDLVQVLVKKVKENNTIIKTETEVKEIEKKEDLYIVKTDIWDFQTKNVIVAVGWKSYPQVGTMGIGYKIAQNFWLDIVTPYKGLCGIVTKQDLSNFSGTTIKSSIVLKHKEKIIYEEYWPLLFTHWGLSWPIVFNLVLALWKYINCWKNNLSYQDLDLEINFDLENTTKKLKKHFNLSDENNILKLDIQDLRSWKEAKVTGGGVDTNELTKFLESKKCPWLFFIWEVVDITGKTWWFNLQWAWTSAYCCTEKFN